MRTAAANAGLFAPIAGMAVIIASAALAGTASADLPPTAPEATQHSRVFAGTSAYVGLHSEFGPVDSDYAARDEDAGVGGGVTAGYSHVLMSRWLLLLGALRLTRWTNDWAKAAEETRIRADLAIGPLVYLPLWEKARMSIYFALPAGGTIAQIEPGPHVAISESFDMGYGINYGATVGLAWRPGPHVQALSMTLEGSFLMHSIWLTHRAETLAPPVQSSTETYRIDSRALLLTLGAELWL